jgi:adenosine phosphosulfate reductase beta subunit
MPSFVIPEKCDGCKALDKTACQYICPNDLMVLDKEQMKAYNQEPEMCWECYSCVKMCPVQAVEVRGYADFVPMNASVDNQVPQWHAEALQVPNQNYGRGQGQARRRVWHCP